MRTWGFSFLSLQAVVGTSDDSTSADAVPKVQMEKERNIGVLLGGLW